MRQRRTFGPAEQNGAPQAGLPARAPMPSKALPNKGPNKGQDLPGRRAPHGRLRGAGNAPAFRMQSVWPALLSARSGPQAVWMLASGIAAVALVVLALQPLNLSAQAPDSSLSQQTRNAGVTPQDAVGLPAPRSNGTGPVRAAVNPGLDVIDIRPFVRDVRVDPVLAADGTLQSGASGLPAGRWLVVTLKNIASAPQYRLLAIQSPTLAGSGLFGVGGAGLKVSSAMQWSEGGTAYPLAWEGTRAGARVFEVHLSADRETTVALMVNDRAAGYSMALWEPGTFRRLDRWMSSGKGVVFGMLLVMIAFCAGRWVLHGHTDDFAVLAFLGAGLVVAAVGFGIHFAILPAHYALSAGFRGAAILALTMTGLMLLRDRLDLRPIHPDLPEVLPLVITALGGLALLSLPGFGIQALSGPVVFLVGLTAVASVLFLAREGDRMAQALVPGASLVGLSALAAFFFAFGRPGPSAGPQAAFLTGMLSTGVGLTALAAMRDAMARPLHKVGFGPDPDVQAASVPGVARAAAAPAPLPAAEPLQSAGDLLSQDAGALALAAAHEGVWDLDAATGHLAVSPMVEAMLGLPTGGLEGTFEAWARRLHPEDDDMIRTAIESYVTRGDVAFELEFRQLHEDHTYRWINLRGSALPSASGMAARLIGVVADVSAQKHDELRLIDDGMRDSLTGLANRAVLLDRIDRLMEAAELGEPAPAVLVVDLDRLKTINEGLGHPEGDSMLSAMARRMEAIVSPDDTVARIGGDEFAILLRGGLADEGALVAARLLSETLCEPLVIGDQEVLPSVSVGVATGQASPGRAEDLLRNAEIALFRAKTRGYGQVVEFAPHMRQETSDRGALELALKHAVDHDEIELLYQPVMDLGRARLAGFEALMRWRHPERGLIPPDQFIALAEETGAIVDLGRRALELAVDQLEDWHAQGTAPEGLFVSVNVSSRQLLSSQFAEEVQSILAPADLPARSLRLEVTESLVMANPETAASVLQTLLGSGIGLALDDFGTGYSSLAYLHRFHFEVMKIDRSFIAAMQSSEEARTIVRSMTDLGHSLGMEVVAEGPETDEDIRLLREMGCDFAQGYVFGAPLPADGAGALLGSTRGAANPPSARTPHKPTDGTRGDAAQPPTANAKTAKGKTAKSKGWGRRAAQADASGGRRRAAGGRS